MGKKHHDAPKPCKVYAFFAPKETWHRMVHDSEGRIAYITVEESEILKGDLRTEIPAWSGLIGVSNAAPKT